MLKRIILILVVLACAAGGIWWLYDGKRQPSDLLTLYGNVDIRQVDVGFRVGGRVTELFKEEGDAVKTGERLARLDAKPYEEVFDQAAAQLSMQEIELRKMVAGYRTEDIEQARANKIDIMATNTNVLPGGEVPFMVVFNSPPDNAAEFGVKVIDARIPPEKEKK